MASDFVPPRPDKPIRFSSPDVHWGKWLFRGAVLALAIGVALFAAFWGWRWS